MIICRSAFRPEEKVKPAVLWEILGFDEIAKPAQLLASVGIWHKVADIEVHIGIDLNAVKSKARPAFEVAILNSFRTCLEASQVIIKDEIELEGQMRFSLREPVGNRTELIERKNI